MIGKGCGCASGIFKYIPVPEADYFYVPCCLHDDDYDQGIISRETADLCFRARCLQLVSRDKTLTEGRRIWLKGVAWGYYLMVRLFGWAYYNKK